jgi:expansin (peptidoglycan-binding protein)
MKRLVLALIAALIANVTIAGCPPPYSSSGVATFYDTGTFATGACSVPNVDGVTAAITSARWNNAAHCGECLNVTGPLGSTIVRITDECPTCQDSGLDLTTAAFAKIADPVDGIVPITWERVDCAVTGGLSLQVQDGSNPYYLSVLATNTNQAVASISAAGTDSGNWQSLVRQSYGYYVDASPSPPFMSSISVRLTSQSGQVLDLSAALASATGPQTYTTTRQFDGCTDRIFADDFTSDQ